jgi:hypothetical protein
MQLFHPADNRESPSSDDVYAAYEVAYTIVDFSAAAMFVVGSVLFFWESTTFAATWLFLLGSLCFAAKPSIRMAREIHLLRLGKKHALAERLSA